VRASLIVAAAAHRTDVVVADSLTRFGVCAGMGRRRRCEFVDWLTDAGLGRELAADAIFREFDVVFLPG
jgi:hypothetical protein